MQKVINKIINDSLINSEIYQYNNSLWVLKPDTPRWIVEITQSNWLWFNIDHFHGLFSYLSMDINDTDTHNYILEWGNNYFFKIIGLSNGDFKINRVYPNKGFDYNWEDQFNAVKVITNGEKYIHT